MNTFNIAKKEFSSLIRDPLCIFILAGFCIFALDAVSYMDVYFYRDMISGASDFVSVILQENLTILTRYGSVVALMIGFCSMSSEHMGNSLSTLILKPVYRDTIINGKLLGCFSFLFCIFCFVNVFYIAMLLIFYGSMTVSALPAVLGKMPFILFISLIYVTIYMLLSMLITTIVKTKGVALMLTIISFFFIHDLLLTANFAGNISILFGANDETILEYFWAITPRGILRSVIRGFNSPSVDLISTLSGIGFDMFKLLLMVVVLVAMNYSLLLRRDIQ